MVIENKLHEVCKLEHKLLRFAKRLEKEGSLEAAKHKLPSLYRRFHENLLKYDSNWQELDQLMERYDSLKLLFQ